MTYKSYFNETIGIQVREATLRKKAAGGFERILCGVLVKETLGNWESNDRSTGHHHITEIMLKTAVNTLPSIMLKKWLASGL